MDRTYGNTIKVMGHDPAYVKELAIKNIKESLPEDMWDKVIITVTPEEVSWMYKP